MLPMLRTCSEGLSAERCNAVQLHGSRQRACSECLEVLPSLFPQCFDHQDYEG
jgi:hypothetical protein